MEHQSLPRLLGKFSVTSMVSCGLPYKSRSMAKSVFSQALTLLPLASHGGTLQTMILQCGWNSLPRRFKSLVSSQTISSWISMMAKPMLLSAIHDLDPKFHCSMRIPTWLISSLENTKTNRCVLSQRVIPTQP